MGNDEKIGIISLMTTTAVAIARRSGPVPGTFRLGFMDGRAVCIGMGEPAPGFIEVTQYNNNQLDLGFTAKAWLVLAAKMSSAYKEKVLCQKQCKS